VKSAKGERIGKGIDGEFGISNLVYIGWINISKLKPNWEVIYIKQPGNYKIIH